MASTDLSAGAMAGIAVLIQKAVETHPSIRHARLGPPQPRTENGTRYELLSLDGRYDEGEVKPVRDDPAEAAEDLIAAAHSYISDEVGEDPSVLIWRRVPEFKFIPRHHDGGGYTGSMRFALEAA